MNAQTSITAFTDAAADAVAREIARLRKEASREEELRQALFAAKVAELELRLSSAATIERDLSSRLAVLRDGADGQPGVDGKDGRDGVDGRDVEDISVTQDGKALQFSFTVGEFQSLFNVELPEGPAGVDGKDGERGERGPEGRLTTVKEWTTGVHYEGEIKSHNGATWQAVRDTAQEPPGEDWACIASRGADGTEGKSFNPLGLWKADAEYSRLDVVTLNGGSFVALADSPGPCPGDGWRLLASKGERGGRGEKGERGERGMSGPALTAAELSDDGVMTLISADGSRVECDFYPLLSRIGPRT